MKINLHDCAVHTPSGKKSLVSSIQRNSNLSAEYIKKFEEDENNTCTNFYDIRLYPDYIGGVYGGAVIKLYAKKFTLKWFYSVVVIMIKHLYKKMQIKKFKILS